MEFKKKVLSNGLTVLFKKRDVDVTTVMLGVRYGAGYDSAEDKGMAHFIEHLCFKGTEKRSASEIASQIERFGGDINAFTGDELTAYFAKLPSNHFDVAMEVIFDVFFNPVFPEEEVKKEALVICEEIKMYRDNPRFHVLEKVKANLYEEPFSMSIAGSEENVLGMSRGDLLERHRDVYVPGNSILVVVGNNDFDEVVSLAEKFSVDRKGVSPKFSEIVLKSSESEEKRDNLSQANLAIGFHFPKAGDKDSYAAEVFCSILGDGMSSRLFSEVREKRGLVYGVKSDFDSGKDFGYLVIWAGTDASKVEEVKRVCLEEFSKMENLTEEELLVGKVRVVGNRKVESEDASHTALELMLSEVRGKGEDYYEFEKNINEVSLDDVRGLAKKTDFSFFSLGP